MHKFLLSTLACVCFSFLAKAQTTAQPAQQALSTLEQGKYTLNVVFKVKGISSITPLDDAQQLALAEFFKQEDESLNSASATSIAPIALAQLKTQLIAKFQSLLTTEQLAVYSAKYPGSYLAKKVYGTSSMQIKL